MEFQISVKFKFWLSQISCLQLALRWTHWLPLVFTLRIVIPKTLGQTAHNECNLIIAL